MTSLPFKIRGVFTGLVDVEGIARLENQELCLEFRMALFSRLKTNPKEIRIPLDELEEAVFKLLNLIVVFPVEDEHHWSDKSGNVLPDAFLVPRGSTAADVAFKVHTDLGNHFIRAINARTKMVVGRDHPVEDGDVIKIVAKA